MPFEPPFARRPWYLPRLGEADPSLSRLQVALCQRAYLTAMGLCAVLFVRDLVQGLPLGLLPVVAGGALAAYAGVRRWPQARLGLALALGLTCVAAVAEDGLRLQCASPPSSVFLLLACPLLVLVADAWVGLVMGVASVALWCLLARLYPPDGERGKRLLENLFMLTPALLATAWFFHGAFVRLGQELEQRWRAWRRHDADNRALGDRLFGELKAPLMDMELAMAGVDADRPRLQAAYGRLSEGVLSSRALARATEPAEEADGGADAFLVARFKYLRVSVWFIVAAMMIPVLGSVLRGQVNALTYMNAAVGLTLGAFALLGLRTGHSRASAWFLLVPTLLESIPGLRFWAPPGQAPGLIAVPAMVIIAGFWDGWGMAWTAALTLSGVVLFDAHLAGGAAPRLEQDFDALACVVLALFTVGQALDLHDALIGHLQGVLQRLKLGLGRRRRLLGILFHDLANPMAVIHLSLDPAEPLDRSALLGQVRRLQGLLAASQPIVLGPDGEAPASLRAAHLGPLLGELEALFRHRLLAKGLSLQLTCPPQLVVHTVPELLGGSVLANLLSNAIKFSPAGGRIRVEAQDCGGVVELKIVDEGSGFPEDVLAAWRQGRDPRSRSGSAGEGGQGLGLGLARDYLSRMGGSMELDRAPEGGAVALLFLPSAQAEASSAV